MTDGQKTNKPLFSQHYLDHRIQGCSEWQLDVVGKFESLKKLYLSKKDLLPKLSEAQTEAEFIKPVLDILGFSNIPQVTTRGKGRAERPDYALFTSESDRDSAYPLQSNETAFYARVSAIAEAKYWERALSKASANDQRDIYKNANPSFQITNYLTGTGVDWGILTNGREWRLYYRLASSTATEFYQVDLVELLESQDEDKLEKFKYFWLFFCGDSFVKDPQGRNFLERVREGSNTYATQVGKELKTLVFEQVFPSVAGGFAANAFRLQHQVTSEEIYEATLSFLYKLLFLLYAEARNLLPINSDYRDYSLIEMSKEVAQGIGNQKKFSQTGTGLYDRLLSLFQIIDRGDPSLDVPRYNGGLFHFDFNQDDDQVDYPANHFLFRFKLSDAILAPALDKLARFEGLPIDYSFLGVRQLGSIYEGLLEYRVVLDNAENGEVHLESDKGERKSTGSYYTPDYIVKYIVSNTLKPILEKRSQRFSELMVEISQLHQQMQDKRLGVQSRNGLQKDLQRLEREAQTTLLDIKVCDPSMGSGHFLVEAVDYLTDELILILNQYPESNPILEMLNQTRESILENLAQQGIRISPDRLEPTQLLQRVVMKRCIYGVDLNQMAVELAKVSLWLHSFTVGAPLSFLDHHLRCGNSLIGTTVKEAEASMVKESTGQFNLLAGPFVGLLRAAEIMRGVSILSDATFAELEQSEKLFRQFDQAAKPYKQLLDIYVSKFFGLKRADHFLRVFGTNAISADLTKMNKADAAVYKNAQKLSDEKHFFHWDLEFPEVFIDLENARWQENAGFDAVIGNPPYGLIEPLKWSSNSYNDAFVYFWNFGLKSTCDQGYTSFIIPAAILTGINYTDLRQNILNISCIKEVVTLPYDIFAEAYIDTCIILTQVNRRQENYFVHTKKMGKKDDLHLLKNITYQEISIQEWKEDTNFKFILSKELLRIQKIKKDSQFTNLGAFSRIERGVQLYDTKKHTKEQIKNDFLRVPKLIESQDIYYPELLGEELSRYRLQPQKRSYIKYCNDLASRREEILFTSPRVVLRRLLSRRGELMACYCEETLVTTDNILSILVLNVDINPRFITALINSKLVSWLYTSSSTISVKDDFPQVTYEELKNLPIPIINFSLTEIDRKELLSQFIKYCDQSNFLPSKISEYIDFAAKDLIHDLLAYLAEQMIELNTRKQTEIKSFLKWLERFIGCEIETLTNKSKIQNYLGDYYKNESTLSFDDLIEVLKKNKKKIKIDPVARKEQQSLEKEYQDSLNTLLPIKEQLTNCDKLIDAIVYRLYGLTQEEIAIVEGMSNPQIF
ncbi:Eco57I restriction-modification methylase domain-containing protein [Pseudanabaena minima]|uniref:Eco57I restriction-modification methylase domain-containing protein n=1 Tax=Pseudanabaena minima TaxID=890415 RepID=UPI003DA7EAE8